MGRATRSSVPMELPGKMQHGASGYRFGCGCQVCRAWQQGHQQDYKAKRAKAQKAHADDQAATKDRTTGSQERLIQAEIDNLGELSDEQQSLAHLAIVHAKLVDTIEKEERWHLLNATTRSLRETMKDLRGTLRITKPKEEDEDDDLNLRGFG